MIWLLASKLSSSTSMFRFGRIFISRFLFYLTSSIAMALLPWWLGNTCDISTISMISVRIQKETCRCTKIHQIVGTLFVFREACDSSTPFHRYKKSISLSIAILSCMHNTRRSQRIQNKHNADYLLLIRKAHSSFKSLLLI